MFRIFFVTFFLLCLVGSPVSAGNLKGKINFSGNVPPIPMHKTGKFSKACGPEIAGEELLVENKGVKNTVLWLTGRKAKKVKADPKEYVLDQSKCQYHPHVTVMVKESELLIRTSDPINHNIHTYSFDNDPINIMFVPGQEHSQEFEEAEVVKVECDLHSWMHAWIVVTPNPLNALTDKEGNYEINNIPPGKYTLNIWHEAFGEASQKIEINDGDTEFNFDLISINPQVSKK